MGLIVLFWLIRFISTMTVFHHTSRDLNETYVVFSHCLTFFVHYGVWYGKCNICYAKRKTPKKIKKEYIKN